VIEFKTIPTPEGWTPIVTCDLATISPAAFRAVIDRFKAATLANPSSEIPVTTGWHMVTPYLSELLLKKTINGNRYVGLTVVQQYARDMKARKWQATGESGIIDEHGNVRDMQHRGWAGYLSGADFPLMIVTGVPDIPGLSAHIDMGKGRTPADALVMAGHVPDYASPVAAGIAVAWRYENRAYRVIRNPSLDTLTNPEVVDWFVDHQSIGDAAKTVLGNFPAAVKQIKHKGVAVFTAWKILGLYGPQALEQFMLPLGSGVDLDDDDPVSCLRTRLQLDDDNLNVARRLGLVIKAFNMKRLGQTVRLGRGRNSGFNLGDNEAFPRFEEQPEEMDEAAQ
jgi:hypothetical protein